MKRSRLARWNVRWLEVIYILLFFLRFLQLIYFANCYKYLRHSVLNIFCTVNFCFLKIDVFPYRKNSSHFVFLSQLDCAFVGNFKAQNCTGWTLYKISETEHKSFLLFHNWQNRRFTNIPISYTSSKYRFAFTGFFGLEDLSSILLLLVESSNSEVRNSSVHRFKAIGGVLDNPHLPSKRVSIPLILTIPLFTHGSRRHRAAC